MYCSIETPRLRLRPWRTEDFEPFARLNASAEVMRYFPRTLTQAESHALMQKFQGLIELNGWGFWAIELKQAQRFIGFCGLHFQPDMFEFSPCTEIGWRLDAEYWHQGYATEAAEACLHFAFDILKLEEVVAFTAKQNSPSEALMQRLGMQPQGYFDHPKLDQDSPLLTHALYRITPADFLKNRGECGLNQSIRIEQAQKPAIPE